MSVSVKVPDELYQKAVEIANEQHVSVDEVFASAFIEQLSVWSAFSSGLPWIPRKIPCRDGQGS